ncbi:IclR family transcriptional regulator [Actinophytocola sediminis]
MAVTTQVGSQAVDRAAALLALVVESSDPRSFTSLVDDLGLAKSTTSRLLQALERNRLVRRDRDGSFRPGPLFAVYAARHDTTGDLVELARPTMDRLSELTGETVNLAVPRAGELVQVAQVDSSFLLGATNWLGVSVPPHCTALGKVFYANRVMALQKGELRWPTDRSMTRARLERELAEVVRRGWALAWDELEEGLAAIAAPVHASDGSVVAAISVSGSTTRITKTEVPGIGATLVEQSRVVSQLLGHKP